MAPLCPRRRAPLRRLDSHHAALGDRGVAGSGPTVLLAGTLPHLLALSSPLFLSEDPLAYAAFGHAIAKYHADPRLPLDQVLPALDPFLRSVQAGWRPAASAYSPGFNALAALIARVGGDDLARQLQLYQLLGLG